MALGVALVHVVFGAIVRISGSGMGCGDHWPKCYGRWFPPLERMDLIIEVFHRYLAVLLLVSIAAAVVTAFQHRRAIGVSGKGGVLRALSLMLGVAVFAAVFGAVTVKFHNAPWATVVHKLIAATVLGAGTVAVLRAGGLGAARIARGSGSSKAVGGATAAAAVALAVVILGGLTAKIPDAAVACAGFPLCGEGSLGGGAQHVQLTHRVLAYLLVLHLSALPFLFGKRGEPGAVRAAAWTGHGLRPAAGGLGRLDGDGRIPRRGAVAAPGHGHRDLGVGGDDDVPRAHRGRTHGARHARRRQRGTDRPGRRGPRVTGLVLDESAPDGSPEDPAARAVAARAAAAAARPVPSLGRDLVALTKPRIISLLLVTTAAPDVRRRLALAARRCCLVMLGGYLMAGGANAVNMYLDRDIDDVMARTRLRPIPSGRMTPRQVLAFGVACAWRPRGCWRWFVNVLTAALALAGFYFYVFIYTRWLKRSSPQNIVIGGAAGAFPPLVGWAAVTGSLDIVGDLRCS